MKHSPIIIAIDGPSASGKGTIAKRLAAHFGFAHLDTGLLYRAVGLALLKAGQDPSNAEIATKTAQALNTATLTASFGDPALRDDTTAVAASKAATIPAVRQALLQLQKDFCAVPPDNKRGTVLDGRDIGTVIAPHAPVKIYVTANTEIRAERRLRELQGRGENVTYATVLKDMHMRDARDAQRAVAPAKPALDAIILDTSILTAEQAFAEALMVTKKKLDSL